MNEIANAAKIHLLLKLILAVLLLRLGMDYTPFGKSSIAGVIALVSAYAGLGLLIWVVMAAVISLFTGRGPSDVDRNP